MGDLVAVRTEGSVAIVTLDRPEKLNALSSALESDLGAALGTAEVADARAIVIAGAGRSFSVGADVTEMRGQTPADILAYYRATGDVYERVSDLPMPTVAAIHGHCLGGGLELALACDLRVADATAVFGLPEVALGIVPSSGGLLRLVQAVGPARTKELVLLRERFGSEEAERAGLVTAVVPEGTALAGALEIARRLADLPATAVEVAKRAIDASAVSSREAALLIERLAYAALAQTSEHEQATAAFLERRRRPSEG